MSAGKPVVASPVKASGNEKSGLFELKPLKNTAIKDADHNTPESQKLFSVSDGLSFEDQAGFLGRW